MDGCSNICTVEKDFFCEVEAGALDSSCTYTKPIDFNIEYLEKVPGDNSVIAQMTISPLLKAFETYNFSSLVSTDLPVDEYSFDYNPKTGVLGMKIKYSSSIEGLNATVTINPPNS